MPAFPALIPAALGSLFGIPSASRIVTLTRRGMPAAGRASTRCSPDSGTVRESATGGEAVAL